MNYRRFFGKRPAKTGCPRACSTVALRLIVEREKEIKLFKSEDYFQIFGNFEAGHPKVVKSKAVNFKDDLLMS